MDVGRSLKVLVVMEHPGVGSLMPALKLLHDHGHQLELAYHGVKSVESHQELESFAAECPGARFHELPPAGRGGMPAVASWLRRSTDYVRYLEPRYSDATKLRQRARQKAPSSMARVGRVARLAGPPGVAALRRTLQAVERCMAPAPGVVRFLDERRPDVLIPTHLLTIGTPHADYLRAAKRMGIRTVFPVRGWDNLTNKGLLRDAPDRVLAWNDLQEREAVELHRVPERNVELVGAALCDDWFDWSPSRTRDELCEVIGLRVDSPIVLYVCSSGFVARDEVSFVREWIAKLRAHGEPFSEAGFLIRPHPLNAAQWVGADIGDPQATVWPRFGEAPHDDESRRNYYDSIYHAAAVVGINTTAQIESAIVGRPVHTLLAEDFRDTQQGTLHFHYLKADEFGLLFVGRNFEEHAEQLADSLRGRADDGRNARFLRRFVRPRGLDRPARELIVEAIEELGARAAPAPDRGPLLAPLVRLGLVPCAAFADAAERRRRARKARRASPIADLRHAVRKRALHRNGAPVVAGPWLGDEVGELLYWIPFLRRMQSLRRGLPERVFVVSRASSACWYDGIGAARVDLEQLVGADGSAEVREDDLRGRLRDPVATTFGLGSRAFRVMPAELVANSREQLARQRPATRDERLLLEFAPLSPGPPPAEPELPPSFVAVSVAPGWPELDRTLAGRQSIVSLDGLDRAAQLSAVSRSRGFVGAFGVEALLAVLSGVPAFVDASASDTVEQDLRLVASFLGDAPYGPFHVMDAARVADEAAERAEQLLAAPVEALAAV